MNGHVLTILRSEVVGIMSGTIFVFIGLVACLFAAARRQKRVLIFAWLGIWSAMYGTLLLTDAPGVVALLPRAGQTILPSLVTAIGYLILPVASLAWLELSAGKMRQFIRMIAGFGFVIGITGIGIFVVTGDGDRVLPYANFVAACGLGVLVIILAVPALSRKYLILPSRAVMVVGTLVFAVEGLYYSVARLLHYQTYRITGSMGLAALLFALGYMAVQIALAGERRLVSIENELVIAQEIQASILPSKSPEVKNLLVVTAYHPMTAVAGDFYDFLAVDESRAGFLVADVTGHGVPAALIASMIKVAIHSVVPYAHDPRAVLSGLNSILFAQLKAQLVSAAYLWVDGEKRIALYSAAGHPPLLHMRGGRLELIESNGLLLGALPEAEYPVWEMEIYAGDRFLLYTDGVSEPENGSGEAFGAHRLEEVVLMNQRREASTLLEEVLDGIRSWQPAGTEQKDDITMVAIDVLG